MIRPLVISGTIVAMYAVMLLVLEIRGRTDGSAGITVVALACESFVLFVGLIMIAVGVVN